MRWRRLAFLPSSRSLLDLLPSRSPYGALFSSRSVDNVHHSKNTSFIRLRNATLDDLELLEYWDEQPHLLDPNVMGHDDDFNDWNWAYELARTNVSWRYQLMAELTSSTDAATSSNKSIGFLQIIDPVHEESHYWESYLELYPPPPTRNTSSSSVLRAIDIWIGDETNLGQGYGSQMMKGALEEYCFSDDTVEVVLVDPMEANVDAHRFYQRFGFQPVARHSFGDDHCLVHQLTRKLYYNKAMLPS